MPEARLLWKIIDVERCMRLTNLVWIDEELAQYGRYLNWPESEEIVVHFVRRIVFYPADGLVLVDVPFEKPRRKITDPAPNAWPIVCAFALCAALTLAGLLIAFSPELPDEGRPLFLVMAGMSLAFGIDALALGWRIKP